MKVRITSLFVVLISWCCFSMADSDENANIDYHVLFNGYDDKQLLNNIEQLKQDIELLEMEGSITKRTAGIGFNVLAGIASAITIGAANSYLSGLANNDDIHASNGHTTSIDDRSALSDDSVTDDSQSIDTFNTPSYSETC